MSLPYVHRIDPIFADVGGVYLWYYGLCYTIGFLEVHLWFRTARRRLGFSMHTVYNISLAIVLGVLVGGRLLEVFFYEWAYYAKHLSHIPGLWLGGMSTHGILFGSLLAVWVFCRLHRLSFLQVLDELAIPAAFIMGMGRIGNFIDGQIMGAPTDVLWGVQFPDLDGFRHPVVLYDGIKNLMLIPFLLLLRRARPRRGILVANFIFWYGFLRIFVDLFREYRVDTFGIGRGQGFNLFMSLLGLGIFVYYTFIKKSGKEKKKKRLAAERPVLPLWAKRALFVLLLLFSLTMPSDWTQDVPARYEKRHPGLEHSLLYPEIEAQYQRIPKAAPRPLTPP